MAENKKKIVVYADWLDNFKDLSDEELGKLMRHFFEYVNDLNPVLEDRLLKIAWSPIEATLKRDLKKWNQYTDKQSVNGSKGGRPLKATETQKTQAFIDKPKKAVSVSVSVSDNVNDNVINKIEERKLKFADTLKPFLSKYGRETINDFFKYWTEPNKSKTKFKQELEKTWDTERRLETWSRNDKTFNKTPLNEPKQPNYKEL